MSVEIETLDVQTGPTIVRLFGVMLLFCGELAWEMKHP